MCYGDGDTIHGTQHVDVEVDSQGKVVAVWFRCSTLPFRQTDVDDERARAIRSELPPRGILAIEFSDKPAPIEYELRGLGLWPKLRGG